MRLLPMHAVLLTAVILRDDLHRNKVLECLIRVVCMVSCAGFEESAKGCCGTGTFEVTLTCNSLTASTCEDASKFVFWDSYHPTERAYEILMDQLMKRYGSFLK